MQHREAKANDVRISTQPRRGEVVVITRYGKPEHVVLRWEDFAPLEALIDQYLSQPPYELEASDLATRAAAIDRQPEGDDFDFAGLAASLEP
jgi:hypothetical protein